MSSDLYGVNVIEVGGAPMLLTTIGGGVAVHLSTAAQERGTGREAVPDYYFTSELRASPDLLAGYDRAVLTEPRWSPTTLCGREWAVMVGGEGGEVGPYHEVAFAPTCRRCLTLIDRHFPKPTPDSRLSLVAELAAGVVIDQRGYVEIHDVPGDQQGELRKLVRTLVRKRTGHPVRTYALHGTVYVECEVIYDQRADEGMREAAEAMNAFLAGERPPRKERDWEISWAAWDVS